MQPLEKNSIHYNMELGLPPPASVRDQLLFEIRCLENLRHLVTVVVVVMVIWVQCWLKYYNIKFSS